jgi:transcriptional regulator with XRE-family HTH domain
MDSRNAERIVEHNSRHLAGSIGVDLETWRTDEGLTYAQLAERLGISTSQAHRWCLGKDMPEDLDLVRVFEVTRHEVGAYALHQRRLRWLRENGRGGFKVPPEGA